MEVQLLKEARGRAFESTICVWRLYVQGLVSSHSFPKLELKVNVSIDCTSTAEVSNLTPVFCSVKLNQSYYFDHNTCLNYDMTPFHIGVQ